MPEAASADYRDRIDRVRRWVADRLEDPPSLDEMAEVAAFSKFHFHRVFAAMTGETPADFVRRLRLDRAAHLLVSGGVASVTEIAMMSGFPTPSAFARDFKARFGVSPKAFRERRREFLPSVPGLRDPRVYPCRVGRSESLRLAEARVEGRYDRVAGKAWAKLFRDWFASGKKAAPSVTAGIGWDNPRISGDERCRYSACAVIPDSESIPRGLSELRLEGGPCLTLEFSGSRDDYSSAYDYLYGVALPDSGCLPADSPCIEIYRGIPSRNSIQAEFQLPLK